jgi:hypothetical protein
MTAISDLIERLENAPGPDSELDKEIAAMFGAVNKHGIPVCTGYLGIGLFTSSIDAAVSLCKHILPGWIWRVATCSVSDDAWVMPDFNCPIHGERLKRDLPEVWAHLDPLEFLGTDIDLRPSGRPAIALCMAILTAVEKINGQ